MRRASPWPDLSGRSRTPDLALLERYAGELLRWNRAIRLVGPKDLQGVREQIVDSLLPYLIREPCFPLLDIGSGAGLPGIPLCIAFREARPRVVCLEPQGKRVSFLRQAVRLLGLNGVEVVAARAEEAAKSRPDLVGAFATVTARAVGEGFEILALARPFLAAGGLVFLPRGDEAPAAAPGWKLEADVAYEGPPGFGRRRLHVYARDR